MGSPARLAGLGEMSAAPTQLRNALFGLLAMLGIGGGVVVAPVAVEMYEENAYLRMITLDEGTSAEVKIAMVLGAYYESSFAIRTKPYRDELSSSRPWTVCNGVTTAGLPRGHDPIDPTRSYSMAECYEIERALYTGYERALPTYVTTWADTTPWQRATFMDFVHHFGIGSFLSSTMLRQANAGRLVEACEQHGRWKYTTLPNGAKTVLAGLEVRANANVTICRWGWPTEIKETFG